MDVHVWPNAPVAPNRAIARIAADLIAKGDCKGKELYQIGIKT